MKKSLTIVLMLAAAPAWARTTLSLSVTGSALAAPDEMVAALTVQNTAATAAAAQGAVNQAAAKALAAARAVAGVVATTGNYDVGATDPGPGQKQGFQASQDLNLTMAAPGGVPPRELNDLLGRLQAEGLLLNGLDGRLSASGQDKARQVAVRDALKRLQAQAAVVAVALGDRVANIKSLNLQLDNGGGPVRPMMLMRAAAAPPPQAAPGLVTVTADVNAEVLLVPGAGR